MAAELFLSNEFSFNVFLMNPLADDLSPIEREISQSEPTRYYVCPNKSCRESQVTTVSVKYGVVIGLDANDEAVCDCGMTLNKEVRLCDDVDGGGFLATDAPSFIVFDNLRVVPNSDGLLATLNDLGIQHSEDVFVETRQFEISDVSADTVMIINLIIFSGDHHYQVDVWFIR